MASMWSVAKFLSLSTRARNNAGDKETVKIPSPPLPAPVASEVVVVPDKPEPEPVKVSPPQLPSRTQTQVAPSVPTEDLLTSRENTPKESTWTAENAVVHGPEDTQSLETKVESKASSKRQRSTSPSLHNESDLPTSNPWIDVEPPKPEGEQKDDNLEKVPETGGITDAETLSEKESPPVDTPEYAGPGEQKLDLQDLIRKYEVDLLEKKRFVDDNRRLQDKLRNSLHAVDEKTGVIDRLSEEVGRLREDIRAVELEKAQMDERVRREAEVVRRAFEENEEAAKRETQRVKGMIAVERHSHNERVKEFKEERDELITAREAAQSNVLAAAAQTETQQERIRVLEAHLEDRIREVGRLREDIKAVTLGKEEARRKSDMERVQMEKRWRREMEDVRRACRDNEEAARKETQRVKGMVAVERHSHNEKVKEFKEEKDELIAAVDTAKKETQRVKGLIAIERHSHSERVKEFEGEKDELTTSLETARKETQRVKGLIAVERHSHSEQLRGFKEEKDELDAALTATRSKVLASVARIESQKEQIRSLEGRLEDNHAVTQKLHDKYHDQESMTKRFQEEIVEERNKVLAQMHSLKVKLVEIQSKANKTEQDNRVLREQVSQLQNPVAAVGRFVSSIWS